MKSVCARCGHTFEQHDVESPSSCDQCVCEGFIYLGSSEDTVTPNDVRKAAGLPSYGEVRTTSSTGGQKGVKPERYDLLPVEALDIMARLYAFGSEKYEAHNWRKGYEWSKSYASLMRHATRFWAGEDIDEETGLPHLAGAAFHAFTLMVFMQEQPEFDDRFKN